MHIWGSRTNGPQGIWDYRGYGSQHVLVPGTTGLKTVRKKGPFEALGHMACLVFITFGILCAFTIPYYSILCHTIP